MPSPCSPLSSASTFCLELPVLPPGGLKPLPLARIKEDEGMYWCESVNPGKHITTSIMPSILDMDDAILRISKASDPTKDEQEDTVYGPMRITACSPDSGGGEFTFFENDAGGQQVGYVPDCALRVELTVPSSDGLMTAVVSRVPPRVKALHAAARAAPSDA